MFFIRGPSNIFENDSKVIIMEKDLLVGGFNPSEKY